MGFRRSRVNPRCIRSRATAEGSVRTRRARALRCGLLFGGLLPLVSCHTIDDTYGLPPFYEVYPRPSSVEVRDGGETFVRPLFSLELRPSPAVGGTRDLATTPVNPTSEQLGLSLTSIDAPAPNPPGEAGWRWRSFPPLLDFKRTETEGRAWAFPLWYYRRFQPPSGGTDIDWFLFPILFGGDDPRLGRHFAVFPLGGKLKGILAQDDILFVLFPLLWRARDRDRVSTHILWPFFNTVRGKRDYGWRLWPFYGRYYKWLADGQPRRDHGFVLWPFFIRGRELLHDDPTDVFLSVPFYGHRINRRVDTRTYLWPFYQRHLDKNTGRRTYMGYVIPYRFTEGQFDLWPFFGVKKTETDPTGGAEPRRRYRQFALWPIQRYDWGSDGAEESTRSWFLPFYWHFHYIDKATLRTRSEWKFWPLARYHRGREHVEFDLISPFWFEREEYERYYSRWFNLFRYRWRREISGWELLYGAVMYRRRWLPPESDTDGVGSPPGRVRTADATETATRVPAPRQERLFSILGGLFECGHRGEKTVIRILYVPWW